MINKVVFDKGAIFDYEGIICHIPLQTVLMRTKVEKLIDEQNYSMVNDDLRIPYYDETSERQLLLFVKKGYCFGPMQTYIIKGICEQEDYDEQMETNGLITEWLEVEIE